MSFTKQLAQRITALHAHYTAEWHNNPKAKLPDNDFDRLVAEQHQQNFDLWHEEDNAREPNAEDATIARVKRNIDTLNQRRNDMITHIDEWLAANELADFQDDTLPWNSETLGSIIDRLSISSLKVFHMAEQAERTDANKDHVAKCSHKLEALRVQQTDLAQALQIFVEDIVAGRKQNKLYRQFKMYNDPNLNPKIYGAR